MTIMRRLLGMNIINVQVKKDKDNKTPLAGWLARSLAGERLYARR